MWARRLGYQREDTHSSEQQLAAFQLIKQLLLALRAEKIQQHHPLRHYRVLKQLLEALVSFLL